MGRKLLPNRISTQLTPETIEAFFTAIKAARALLPATPVVPDSEFDSWEKMGETKRAEANATLQVLKDHGGFLPPVLSMSHVEIDLTLYDQLGSLFPFIQRVLVDDLRRLQGIAGAEAMNMLRIAEDKTYADAALNVEDAVKARNAIEKLPRSTDKKSQRAAKPSPAPAT